MRRRLFLLLVCGALGATPPTARAAGSPVVGKLSWLGQSCFVLETAAGTRIVMDPIPKGLGYDLPVGLKADAVTISHEHADHNNVGLLANKPKILRGLTADKKGWTRIDDKIKEVAVHSVGVYHDGNRGAERGLNTVFLFEVGGMRIAHLGDLGHLLTDDQLSAIGAVDVVLIPVGGVFTIDAHQAMRVIDQLHPRLLVIPMHYKTDALNAWTEPGFARRSPPREGLGTLPGFPSSTNELAGVDAFLAGRANVRREPTNTIPLTTLKARPGIEIVVLNYK
jgi:L-ascorbate metabolism protein UlaG (beta-lactamase superfamily)